jgi:methyl-accepting chemotaxis protein
MSAVTEEKAVISEKANLSPIPPATPGPDGTNRPLQIFMWTIGGIGLALLVLFGVLGFDKFKNFGEISLSEYFVFAILLITASACNHFFFEVGHKIYLALSMLIYQVGLIVYPVFPALLIVALPGIWFELVAAKRGLAYAARTAGMYVICMTGARLTFEALDGHAPVGDITLTLVGQVVASFLVFRVLNEAVLIITQLLQGLKAWQLLTQRVITTTVIYIGMLTAAMMLATLKVQVGPVAMVFGCACALMVSSVLKQSSDNANRIVEQLSEVQKLNIRLADQNERQKQLGGHINLTLDSFLSLVREYTGTSHEQEAAVVEITATIEQLSRTASQIAAAADNVADAARKAIDTAEQGQDAVVSTIDAINEVREKVQEIAAKILDLNTKSERIGEIVTTINAIAGQIRLLALNATIEASGAGPFGRRFAVVAAEVNELADRSRQAAQQIREIIGQIQQATNSSVTVTEEGLQRMERSVALANLSERANQEIIEVVQKTAQAAAAISLATQQQRSASEQVVTSVHDVAVMIGQNTEKVTGVSVASMELQHVTRELQAEQI